MNSYKILWPSINHHKWSQLRSKTGQIYASVDDVLSKKYWSIYKIGYSDQIVTAFVQYDHQLSEYIRHSWQSEDGLKKQFDNFYTQVIEFCVDDLRNIDYYNKQYYWISDEYCFQDDLDIIGENRFYNFFHQFEGIIHYYFDFIDDENHIKNYLLLKINKLLEEYKINPDACQQVHYLCDEYFDNYYYNPLIEDNRIQNMNLQYTKLVDLKQRSLGSMDHLNN